MSDSNRHEAERDEHQAREQREPIAIENEDEDDQRRKRAVENEGRELAHVITLRINVTIAAKRQRTRSRMDSHFQHSGQSGSSPFNSCHKHSTAKTAISNQ